MGKKQLILNRIRNPIGCAALRDLVKNKKNILIVTDDFTRTTPVNKILPYVLAELKQADIKRNQIKILVASGTHRPMAQKEIIKKLGKRIISQYKIFNHKWNSKADLVRINHAIYGKRIWVNRLARNADFIIGIGGIVPHATSGFSGGGKIILPGICGKETCEDMHWKALDFQMKDILGVYDNPMRKMIDSVAKRVGLKFIINAVMDKEDRLVDVFAGDLVKAHKKGVDAARKVFQCNITRKADIIVAYASPMDIDLRQAIKAVAASDLVVKNHGAIILVARCPEGVSPTFPDFEKYGFSQPEALKNEVEAGRIKQKLMAYTLIAIGRINKFKAKVILVSKGIDAKTTKKIGFLYAKSLKDAIRKAKELTHKKASIAHLRRACESLPSLN